MLLSLGIATTALADDIAKQCPGNPKLTNFTSPLSPLVAGAGWDSNPDSSPLSAPAGGPAATRVARDMRRVCDWAGSSAGTAS